MSRIRLSDSQFIPELFKLTHSAVQTSNKLPQAEDYLLSTSNQQTRHLLLETSDQIVSLLSKIIYLVNPGVSSTEYDDVVEAVDQCLENIDIQLDTQLNKPPSRIISKLSLYELPKPQSKFSEPIDNSRQFFVPKLLSKPNSKSPLNLKFHPELGYSHPYQEEISSLIINQAQFEPPTSSSYCPLEFSYYSYVDSELSMLEMIDELQEATEIAVDLEHHSFRSYQGITCLMQISTREKDYIIDVFSVWDSMKLLLYVFSDPSKVKVFHGADSDILWLERDFGIYVVNMFDTCQAARVLLYPKCGLAYLLDKICCVSTNKSYQLADWRVRPLPDEYVKYARMDTHYLLYLYDRLRLELIEKAKELHMEPWVLIKKVFEKSCEICLKRYEKPDSRSIGVKGCVPVEKRGLFEKVLDWRDEVARELDEHPTFIMKGKVLMHFINNPPKSLNEILSKIQLTNTDVKKKAKNLLKIFLNYVEETPKEENLPVLKVDRQYFEYEIQTYSLAEKYEVNFPEEGNLFNGNNIAYDPRITSIVEGVLTGFPEEKINKIEEKVEIYTEVRNKPIKEEDEMIPLSIKEKFFFKRKAKNRKNKKLKVNQDKKEDIEDTTVGRIGYLDNIEQAPVKRKNLFKKKKHRK